MDPLTLTGTYVDTWHTSNVKMAALSNAVLVKIRRTMAAGYLYSEDNDLNAACSFAQEFVDEYLPGHIAYAPANINGTVFRVRIIKADEVIFG